MGDVKGHRSFWMSVPPLLSPIQWATLVPKKSCQKRERFSLSMFGPAEWNEERTLFRVCLFRIMDRLYIVLYFHSRASESNHDLRMKIGPRPALSLRVVRAMTLYVHADNLLDLIPTEPQSHLMKLQRSRKELHRSGRYCVNGCPVRTSVSDPSGAPSQFGGLTWFRSDGSVRLHMRRFGWNVSVQEPCDSSISAPTLTPSVAEA